MNDGNIPPKKNVNVKKTNTEFISDAVEIHGDKYKYDKVVYIETIKQK
jgi:hypothetical protein